MKRLSKAKNIIRKLINEQSRPHRGKKGKIQTIEVTLDNVNTVGPQLEKLSGETGITAELTKMLNDPSHTVYEPRWSLPNCNCTHPPSMGFCTFGMCAWGSLKIGKGFWGGQYDDFSGTISITWNF
tara:strand:+ start:1954 stop:2331 length:378 start_codon:yes stop_codon:yes gene_type:complete